MGLLQKLKSALGLDGTGSSETGRSGDVDVTVEREPSTADEDAVKGTETASSGDEPAATSEPDDAGRDEPSADEFETLADDADTVSEPETDSAAGETEADDTAERDSAAGETEADDTAETDESDEETADTAGSTDPVTELKGIGPAYGDRLADAGIETVGELAGADAAELADRIELGESRVAGWIDQANDY